MERRSGPEGPRLGIAGSWPSSVAAAGPIPRAGPKTDFSEDSPSCNLPEICGTTLRPHRRRLQLLRRAEIKDPRCIHSDLPCQSSEAFPSPWPWRTPWLAVPWSPALWFSLRESATSHSCGLLPGSRRPRVIRKRMAAGRAPRRTQSQRYRDNDKRSEPTFAI